MHTTFIMVFPRTFLPRIVHQIIKTQEPYIQKWSHVHPMCRTYYGTHRFLPISRRPSVLDVCHGWMGKQTRDMDRMMGEMMTSPWITAPAFVKRTTKYVDVGRSNHF